VKDPKVLTKSLISTAQMLFAAISVDPNEFIIERAYFSKISPNPSFSKRGIPPF